MDTDTRTVLNPRFRTEGTAILAQNNDSPIVWILPIRAGEWPLTIDTRRLDRAKIPRSTAVIRLMDDTAALNAMTGCERARTGEAAIVAPRRRVGRAVTKNAVVRLRAATP